ncbi:MAG: extracellular solute-binding protein, partial [Clostridia bacterium]|nr:extracellular solute-binding protein [Clostridia bacterium]
MKNVKVLLSVLLALAMLIGATAAFAEDFSVDTLEVKIWDNNQLAGLQQIADEWTAQSGVKVNIQVVDWGNYWTLLEAGASGGDMPDVFWMHSNNAEMYMNAHKLLDLTDYIAASDVVNLENYYQGITDLYSKDGRNYAVAKDHDTIALLYNKALFDQYGVEYPNDDWTWEDYKAA